MADPDPGLHLKS
jgi:hypothetical protein